MPVDDLRSYIVEVLEDPKRSEEAYTILSAVRERLFSTKVYPVTINQTHPEAPGRTKKAKA